MRINTSTRIVDLSRPIADDMIIWPGSTQAVFEWIFTHTQHGLNETVLRIDVHNGTHVDAMRHHIKDGLAIDEIPLDNFYGRAVVHRVKEEPCGQEITVSEVREARLGLEKGDIFVLDTGIYKYNTTARFMKDFPTPEQKLLRWLYEKGVKTYATDAPSVGRNVGDSLEPNHRWLLAHGIPIVESLTNLGELPEGTAFTLFAFPLKFKGRDGSPCRAVAITEAG